MARLPYSRQRLIFQQQRISLVFELTGRTCGVHRKMKKKKKTRSRLPALRSAWFYDSEQYGGFWGLFLNAFLRASHALQILGRKHVSYGVKAEMYPSVGEALLLTLDKGLGAECTPETKAAWTWVMGVISGVCIKAAKEVDPSYGETKEKEEEEKEGKDTEAPVAAITKGKEEDTVEAPVSTVTQEADPVAEKAEEKNDKAVETVENPEETPKTAVGEQKEACPRCTACPCSE